LAYWEERKRVGRLFPVLSETVTVASGGDGNGVNMPSTAKKKLRSHRPTTATTMHLEDVFSCNSLPSLKTRKARQKLGNGEEKCSSDEREYKCTECTRDLRAPCGL